MDSISGITEYSIFNVIESPDKTGYQYFKLYAENIIEQLNKAYSAMPTIRCPFEFEYISFFDFSSGAYHEEGVDKVVINDGVLITTFQVFYSIFSKFPVLSFFNDSTTGDLEVNFLYEFKNNQQYEVALQYPIELERRILAEYTASIAIKFVILHEIAHHYDGHILYLDSCADNPCKSISILDFQTMEMDADAFAISRLIDEMLILLKTDTRLCSIIKKAEDLFVMFSFAISVLFLIINDEDIKEVNDISSTYLSTLLRLSMCLDCAKVNIKHKAKGIITESVFEDIYKKTIPASNQYYSLFGKSHYEDAMKYNKETSKIFGEINENWIKLRKELLPYARIPLA